MKAPIGKQKLVSGTITDVRRVRGPFGTRYRVTVGDLRGFQAVGTLPKPLRDRFRNPARDVLGLRVRFTADLEPSDRGDDLCHFTHPVNVLWRVESTVEPA